MCGRFAYYYSWKEIHSQLDALVPSTALTPRYNLCPSQSAPVVCELDNGKREARMLTWGLIPAWAKENFSTLTFINARAETVANKPSFRNSFHTRRCVIPISGFFEWKKIDSKTKQPYFISARNSAEILFLAGIWDTLEHPELERTGFAILTTSANLKISEVHDRMPAILTLDESRVWLSRYTDLKILLELLATKSTQKENLIFDLRPVSKLVNNPGNDSPLCLSS